MRSKWFPGPRSQVAGLLLLLATAYSLQPTACFAQMHPHSFSPRQLSGSLQLWLRADAVTGLADGNAVAVWPDSSAYSHDAIQTGPTLQPLYKINIQNGRPVVRFDGTNDFIDATAVLSQPIVVFAVQTIDRVGGGHVGSFDSINSGFPRIYFAWIQTVEKLHIYAGVGLYGDLAGSALPRPMRAYSILYNGISSALWVNAATMGTGNAGSWSTNGFRIGSTTGGSENCKCDYGEFIVFATGLSDADRQRVERYLLRKWGL